MSKPTGDIGNGEPKDGLPSSADSVRLDGAARSLQDICVSLQHLSQLRDQLVCEVTVALQDLSAFAESVNHTPGPPAQPQPPVPPPGSHAFGFFNPEKN